MKVERIENVITTYIHTEDYTYELRWGSNRYSGDNPEEYELTKITNSNKQRKRLYEYKLVYKGVEDNMEVYIKPYDFDCNNTDYAEIINPLLSLVD